MQNGKFFREGIVERELCLLAALHILHLRLVFGDLVVAEDDRILRPDLVGVFHLRAQAASDNIGLGDKAAAAHLGKQPERLELCSDAHGGDIERTAFGLRYLYALRVHHHQNALQAHGEAE